VKTPITRTIGAALATAFAVSVGVVVVAARPVEAAAACPAPTPTSTGRVSWELRQASGLTTVASSPGVLFTHNDRGLRDSPAPGEDTTYAAVWAIKPNGKVLARFRLVDDNGAPIPYFDTEAISTDREGRIVLADTGTNVDQRVTVALYRFVPPPVLPDQAFTSADVTADVIPIQYFNAATGGSPVRLNVEAFTVDAADSVWFIRRTTGRPYSYTAGLSALDAAVQTGAPARAVRSTRLTVDGPMTDASISPNGTALLVKTSKLVYRYSLAGTTVVGALKGTPCLVASAATKNAAGFGEAIVADDAGGFYTVAESAKTLHSGYGSVIWSFRL
jgi:hypothetical protein